MPQDPRLASLYDETAASDALEEALSRSLSPRAPTMLIDAAAEAGAHESLPLLDVGCRDATHTCDLARRLDRPALGIDVVESGLVRADAVIAAAGLMGRVRVARASMEAIPARDRSCGIVFCRDVIVHIRDLARGLRECRRVLAPGAAMVVYATFATDLLEPREAAWLVDVLALAPMNLSPAVTEEAFTQAGLRIERRDVIASEWREQWEESGRRTTSEALLRAARLRRQEEALVARFGRRAVDVALAGARWGVYQMLGKLEPRLYVLRRAGA